jgi:hypothetical protein
VLQFIKPLGTGLRNVETHSCSLSLVEQNIGELRDDDAGTRKQARCPASYGSPPVAMGGGGASGTGIHDTKTLLLVFMSQGKCPWRSVTVFYCGKVDNCGTLKGAKLCSY